MPLRLNYVREAINNIGVEDKLVLVVTLTLAMVATYVFFFLELELELLSVVNIKMHKLIFTIQVVNVKMHNWI